MVVVSTLSHEYSHKLDLKDYVYQGEICYLSFPENITFNNLFNDAIGYYSYYENESYSEEIKQVKKYTEIKAYSITFGIIIIFLVCVIIEIFRRIKTKDAVDFYNYFNEWYYYQVKQNV